MCHGAVVQRHDTCPIQWAALSGAEQHVDLRTDGHTIDHRGDTNPRLGHVIISGGEGVNIDFPFHFDGRHRTATADESDHIRDLIEQFIFTNAGERVNRPDFGSGLLQLVHAPNSPELATALQFTMQAGLNRWLGDLIEVRSLQAEAVEEQLRVSISYVIRRTNDAQTVELTRRYEP